MRPGDVGANPSRLVPGKHSGRRVPHARLAEMGGVKPGKDFTHFKNWPTEKKCSTMRT